MKISIFYADAHVSKTLYNSAVVLEDYLKKSNDYFSSRWANQTLMRYSGLIKPLVDLKTHKEYYGKLLLKNFITTMNTRGVDPFVVSLVRNIITTKHRIQILGIVKKKEE